MKYKVILFGKYHNNKMEMDAGTISAARMIGMAWCKTERGRTAEVYEAGSGRSPGTVGAPRGTPIWYSNKDPDYSDYLIKRDGSLGRRIN